MPGCHWQPENGFTEFGPPHGDPKTRLNCSTPSDKGSLVGHVYAVLPAALVDVLLGATPHERDARDEGADVVDVVVVEIAE